MQLLKLKIYLVLLIIVISCNNSSSSDTSTTDSSKINLSTDSSKISATTEAKVDSANKKVVPRLDSVRVRVATGTGNNEGVDFNSTVQFQVQHPNYSMVAEYTLGRGINDGEVYEEPMAVRDNRIQKSELDNTILYIEINAHGRDSHKGTPSVTYFFSDGERITKKYEGFQVGTYHESNNTHQRVIP